MVSFTSYKVKLEKKVEKVLEEKQPIIVTRKSGEEYINTNLKSLSNPGMTIDLDRFNEHKFIAESFYKLSKSILDTGMLLNSWVSHGKINVMEKDAIYKYLMGE